MRRVIVVSLLIALVFTAGFGVGLFVRWDVEAFNAAMVAVEPEGHRDGRCYGDVWIVAPGDTAWDIAKSCYPGEHTGQMVAEIRAANPGIDPGRMQFGDVLVLPERGR